MCGQDGEPRERHSEVCSLAPSWASVRIAPTEQCQDVKERQRSSTATTLNELLDCTHAISLLLDTRDPHKVCSGATGHTQQRAGVSGSRSEGTLSGSEQSKKLPPVEPYTLFSPPGQLLSRANLPTAHQGNSTLPELMMSRRLLCHSSRLAARPVEGRGETSGDPAASLSLLRRRKVLSRPDLLTNPLKTAVAFTPFTRGHRKGNAGTPAGGMSVALTGSHTQLTRRSDPNRDRQRVPWAAY